MSFVLLGFSLPLPRICFCPLLGQQHLSPMTLTSAVLAGVFFYFFTAYFTSSLLCKIFYSSCDLSYECLFSVLFIRQYLCLTKRCPQLLYLLPLSVFCPLMYFLSFLSPFIYLLSTSLSPPLCHSFYTLSCSLLSDTSFCLLPNSTFLLAFLLQAVPLVTVLFLPYFYIFFYLNITYMYVYVHLRYASFTLQLKTRNDSC